jgi:thymidylate kinase
MPQVNAIIRECCARSGWDLVRVTSKDFRIKNFVLASIGGAGAPKFIVLDIMTVIGWHGYTAWDSGEILKYSRMDRGVRKLVEPAEAAVTAVTSLAYVAQFKKPRYEALVRSAAEERSAIFVGLMTEALGENSSDQVCELLSNGGQDEISRASALVRSALKRTASKNPFHRVTDLLWSIMFKIKRTIAPPGMLIAVIGTDGSGKSTVVQGISEHLRPVFGSSSVAHLRPRLLPDLSRISRSGPGVAIRSQTAATHTRRPGLIGSFIRWGYYWLDYLVGYYVIFRPKMIRKSVVVTDRYFFDFEFDYGQKHVKLPGWLVRTSQVFLPSPDYVVHVDTDTDIVLERRGDEVNKQEVDRQRTALYVIVARLNNAGTVDGNQDADATVSDAIKLIIGSMARSMKS